MQDSTAVPGSGKRVRSPPLPHVLEPQTHDKKPRLDELAAAVRGERQRAAAAAAALWGKEELAPPTTATTVAAAALALARAGRKASQLREAGGQLKQQKQRLTQPLQQQDDRCGTSDPQQQLQTPRGAPSPVSSGAFSEREEAEADSERDTAPSTRPGAAKRGDGDSSSSEGDSDSSSEDGGGSQQQQRLLRPGTQLERRKQPRQGKQQQQPAGTRGAAAAAAASGPPGWPSSLQSKAARRRAVQLLSNEEATAAAAAAAGRAGGFKRPSKKRLVQGPACGAGQGRTPAAAAAAPAAAVAGASKGVQQLIAQPPRQQQPMQQRQQALQQQQQPKQQQQSPKQQRQQQQQQPKQPSPKQPLKQQPVPQQHQGGRLSRRLQPAPGSANLLQSILDALPVPATPPADAEEEEEEEGEAAPGQQRQQQQQQQNCARPPSPPPPLQEQQQQQLSQGMRPLARLLLTGSCPGCNLMPSLAGLRQLLKPGLPGLSVLFEPGCFPKVTPELNAAASWLVAGGASVYHDAARNTLPLPGAVNLVVVDSLQQVVAQGRAQLTDYLLTGAYVVPLAWLQQLREGTAAAAAGGHGASSSRRGSGAAVPPRLTLPEAAWQQIGSWRLFASGVRLLLDETLLLTASADTMQQLAGALAALRALLPPRSQCGVYVGASVQEAHAALLKPLADAALLSPLPNGHQGCSSWPEAPHIIRKAWKVFASQRVAPAAPPSLRYLLVVTADTEEQRGAGDGSSSVSRRRRQPGASVWLAQHHQDRMQLLLGSNERSRCVIGATASDALRFLRVLTRQLQDAGPARASATK